MMIAMVRPFFPDHIFQGIGHGHIHRSRKDNLFGTLIISDSQ